MSKKRAPGRSLDEWMELVIECRQSGLTDAAWCNEHGISPSCFYNAVTRLRKKACQIPNPVGKASTLDLTSHKQDVVQIAIEPESSPAGLIPDNGNRPMHLDNSHTIEIEADGLLIRMSNEIKPLLLTQERDNLKEEIDLLRKKLFGTSSEKRTLDIPGQLNFFNVVDFLYDNQAQLLPWKNVIFLPV